MKGSTKIDNFSFEIHRRSRRGLQEEMRKSERQENCVTPTYLANKYIQKRKDISPAKQFLDQRKWNRIHKDRGKLAR